MRGRTAGHIIRAIRIVSLAVWSESTGKTTTDICSHDLHEFDTFAHTAFLRDVFDIGMGVLQERVPCCSRNSQDVKRIQASGGVKRLPEGLANICKSKNISVQVDIVELSTCGDA